jgi:hypothetical protein
MSRSSPANVSQSLEVAFGLEKPKCGRVCGGTETHTGFKKSR